VSSSYFRAVHGRTRPKKNKGEYHGHRRAPTPRTVHDLGTVDECGLCMLLPNPDCPLCHGKVRIPSAPRRT